MQNEDNLLPFLGKGAKKRLRKRLREQQQPAFVPKQIGLPKKGHGVRYMSNLVPLTTGKTYQAPHHQLESMVELSDDTSPNTPLARSTGGWKPVVSANTGAAAAKVAPVGIKINRQEETASNKTRQNTADSKKTNQQKDDKKDSSEIKWELNEIDDKDIPASIEKQAKSTSSPIVVEGTPSEIKLFQSSIKPAVALRQEAPTTSSQPSTSVNMQSNRSTSQPRQAPMKMSQYNQANWQQQLAEYYNNSGAVIRTPAGIPRSFLMQQNVVGAIHPQDQTQNMSQGWNPNMYESTDALQVNVSNPREGQMEEHQYSPTDAYDEGSRVEHGDGSVSPGGSSGKRLSAFRRLGPVSDPKKPRLSIKLLCNKDVREVLDNSEDDEKYTPGHLRKDVIYSSDETVVKYRPLWPWKRTVPVRKSVTVRNSKSVMILEQEQMEEAYEKDNTFIQVSVRGFPRSWDKLQVLDAILESVKGKSFIPCFTEFTQEECKFLVIRSRSALTWIHKLGFYIRKDDVELGVTISQTDLTLKMLDFIPRLVLRKQLAIGYDGETKLTLKEFTIKSDISNFIYFPLSRLTNQTELLQLQSTVAWNYLTHLDLSHNNITSIDGFDLPKTTPKLKHLDLSYNRLPRVTALLHSRALCLRTLSLQGNPLCADHTDPGRYVRVVRMIFPGLYELDGVKVHLKGDLPQLKRNFCPSEEAAAVASKFLETFFPLLELPCEERGRIQSLYREDAVLTITYRYSLRYSGLHRKVRNIFLRTRALEEGQEDSTVGGAAVARLLAKWPDVTHDPYTFTVDCLLHNDNCTILRIDGILKITSESLAEDEHLLAFSRTVVLTTEDGAHYKIAHETLYWDEPSPQLANAAFQINTIHSTNRLSLKFDSSPDEELKGKLTEIFMKITDMDKKASARCLELKEWNLRSAIEYFMKLLKLYDHNTLIRELESDKLVV